jgi:hypothetical protein
VKGIRRSDARVKTRRNGGIGNVAELRGTAFGAFQDRCLQPLDHPSGMENQLLARGFRRKRIWYGDNPISSVRCGALVSTVDLCASPRHDISHLRRGLAHKVGARDTLPKPTRYPVRANRACQSVRVEAMCAIGRARFESAHNSVALA